MRKALHAIVCRIGVIPWSVGMACMTVTVWMSLLADLIWPNADRGNCWTFAMPRWRQRGGYLAIRPSPRPFQFIPHCIWVWSLEGCTLEQTIPKKRARSAWQAWRSVYFNYRVTSEERRPGETRPAPLGD